MPRLIHPVRTWKSLPHRKKVFTSVAAVFLVLASGALAFYILEATGSGSGSGTLGTAGNQAITVQVAVPNGLTPGTSGNVVVTGENDSANQVSVPSLTPTGITTSTPACDPSWFSLSSNVDSLPVTITPAHSREIGSYTLTFSNTGDQTACSGQSVTVGFSVP